MLVLNQYGDTPAMSKAKATLPEVYLEWGQARRTSGKFEEAETVYQSMSAWAKEQQDDALVTGAAQSLPKPTSNGAGTCRMSRTLMAPSASSTWRSRLNRTRSPRTAPPRRRTPTCRASSRAWGVYLLAAEKYPDAIRHYEISVNLSDPKDVESIKNELSLAYLQWAKSLRKSGISKKPWRSWDWRRAARRSMPTASRSGKRAPPRLINFLAPRIRRLAARSRTPPRAFA